MEFLLQHATQFVPGFELINLESPTLEKPLRKLPNLVT